MQRQQRKEGAELIQNEWVGVHGITTELKSLTVSQLQYRESKYG